MVVLEAGGWDEGTSQQDLLAETELLYLPLVD